MKRAGTGRLVVGLGGIWPTAFEAAWLAEHQPAGVILFSRNVQNFNQLRNLCSLLHQLVPSLEISADHEGGPVSQLAGAVGRPPAAWALGELDDTGLTARVCRETGQRLLAAGVDRVLAPVADVLTQMRNPVIGARSFGSDPQVVSRQVVAAVTGYLESGIKVCLKHWPGHGGSLGDSHLVETGTGSGMVPGPFADGLTAGADAVMVGHLLRSSEEEDGTVLPATLDDGYLTASRDRLGDGNVEGLVFFADDVTMGALGPAMARAGVEVPEALATGLYDPALLPRSWFETLAEAGCDLLLVRGIPAGAYPLTGEPVGIPEPPSGQRAEESIKFGGTYDESRKLLWNDQGCADFPRPESDLLWLDHSRGDRWEAAADPTVGALEACRKILDPWFGHIATEPGEWRGGQPCCRLMVTSHRPLPDSFASALKTLPFLAEEGYCLVLGHPSLKMDLECVLGGGWAVGALGDITPEDLFPGSVGR